MVVENGEIRNDLIKDLKVKVRLMNNETSKGKKVSFAYDGKYGMGYDGCGSHTHDD